MHDSNNIMKRRRKRPIQLELRPRTWGGKREGAGRPKTIGVVPRIPRPEFPRRFPLHVTLRIRREVGSLRNDKIFAQIKKAFLYGHNRFGMRMVEFSVQGNHVHLVVEADNRRSLWRGIQGLSVRIARAVNRLLSRKGRFFGDRYHARILKTPTEVKNAVHYVRNNLRKHRPGTHPWYVDPYSSMSGEACWHDWGELVIAEPRTWMLKQATAPPEAG